MHRFKISHTLICWTIAFLCVLREFNNTFATVIILEVPQPANKSRTAFKDGIPDHSVDKTASCPRCLAAAADKPNGSEGEFLNYTFHRNDTTEMSSVMMMFQLIATMLYQLTIHVLPYWSYLSLSMLKQTITLQTNLQTRERM